MIRYVVIFNYRKELHKLKILKERFNMENRINNIRNEEVIKRGDLYYADLPLNGKNSHIQTGIRPICVLQNNVGNMHSPCIIVSALTTSTKKSKIPTHVLIKSEDINGLKMDSLCLCEQVMTLDKSSLLDKIGKCSSEDMKNIDKALRVSLDLKLESKTIIKEVNTYRSNERPERLDIERCQGLAQAIRKMETLINKDIEKDYYENIEDYEETKQALLYELKKLCSTSEDQVNFKFFYKPLERVTKNNNSVRKLG